MTPNALWPILRALLLILLTLGAVPVRAQLAMPQSSMSLVACSLRECAWRAADAHFWRDAAIAMSGEEPLQLSLSVAWARRALAVEEAERRFRERMTLVHLLGEAPYAPQIEASEFSAEVNNGFFPLIPDRTLGYERITAEGVERIEVTTRPEVRMIEGFPCRVVEVLETLEGEVVERTTDWFSQRNDGSVWLFGESARHYEDGFLEGVEGSFRHGHRGALAGIKMPLVSGSGALYRQEYAVDEAEDVARIVGTNQTVVTSFGTFTGCVCIEEWSPLEGERELKYFAPNLGLVLELNPVTGERLELRSIRD